VKAVGLKFEEVAYHLPFAYSFWFFSFLLLFSSPFNSYIYSSSLVFFFCFNSLLTCLFFYAFFACFFLIICSWATMSFSFFSFVVGQLPFPIVNIFTCYGHLERYALSFFLGFDFLFYPLVYL